MKQVAVKIQLAVVTFFKTPISPWHWKWQKHVKFHGDHAKSTRPLVHSLRKNPSQSECHRSPQAGWMLIITQTWHKPLCDSKTGSKGPKEPEAKEATTKDGMFYFWSRVKQQSVTTSKKRGFKIKQAKVKLEIYHNSSTVHWCCLLITSHSVCNSGKLVPLPLFSMWNCGARQKCPTLVNTTPRA